MRSVVRVHLSPPPAALTCSKHGGVAQLGEHLLCKQGVIGSNPFISTKTDEESERAVRGKSRRSAEAKVVQEAGTARLEVGYQELRGIGFWYLDSKESGRDENSPSTVRGRNPSGAEATVVLEVRTAHPHLEN